MTLVRHLTSAILPGAGTSPWHTCAVARPRIGHQPAGAGGGGGEAGRAAAWIRARHRLRHRHKQPLPLARLGWHVTGLDFAAPAIATARAKAARAGPLAGSVRFLRADVTRSAKLSLGPRCSLLLDLGCLHGIPLAGRVGYVAGVTRHAAPDALFLLYAFQTRPPGSRALGLSAGEVRALFAPGVHRRANGRGQRPQRRWLGVVLAAPRGVSEMSA